MVRDFFLSLVLVGLALIFLSYLKDKIYNPKPSEYCITGYIMTLKGDQLHPKFVLGNMVKCQEETYWDD